MVVPPFGFSVGDFVSVINLVQKVGKALHDQDGASMEYQRLVQSLQALQLIFQHLEGLDSSEVNRSHVNAIQAQAHESLKPLNAFLRNVAKYEKRLGSAATGGKVLGGARKAQWVVTVTDEITKLQSNIGLEVEKMNLLIGVGQLGALSRIEAGLASQPDNFKKYPNLKRFISTSKYKEIQMAPPSYGPMQSDMNLYSVLASEPLNITPTSGAQNLLDHTETVAQLWPVLDRLGLQGAEQASSILELRSIVQGLTQITHTLVAQQSFSSSQSVVASQNGASKFSNLGLICIQKEVYATFFMITTFLGELFRILLLISPQFAIVLRKLQASIIRAPSRLLSSNIIFEDYLGQIRSLEYTYFRHWEVLQAMIQSEFKNKPGELLIMRKMFHIINTDGDIITRHTWSERICPGTSVAMSMMMRNLRVRKQQCPRPSCPGQCKAISKARVILQCPKCELKFSPIKDSNRPNTRREFQVALSSKKFENSTNMITKYGQETTDGIKDFRPESPLIGPHDLLRRPRNVNNIAEWRSHQLKLHAWRREQVEVTLFKRIHIPEVTGAVSFWQVAIVCSLLLSWKRRIFTKPGQHKPLDNVRWGLSSEKTSQLLALSGEYPNTYDSYVMDLRVATNHIYSVYRARKADDRGLARDITMTEHHFVAVKEICISEITSRELNEIATLKEVNHRNIIGFHDLVWQSGSNSIWIVTEYADCGTLLDLIGKDTIGEDHMATICREISQGLAYLHSCNIIYRDVKSENILLFSSGDLKISDFFLCARNKSTTSSILGTPYWMAPEAIKGKEYDAKVDTWGLGILTIEMMEKLPPYIDEDPLPVLEIIAARGTPTLEDPDKWSCGLKAFLSVTLCVEVSHRWTIEELLHHDFLKQGCSKAELRAFILEAVHKPSYWQVQDKLFDEFDDVYEPF